MKYKVSKVSLRLPISLVKELDKISESEGISRTDLIRGIFEHDFGSSRKVSVDKKAGVNDVKVSFLLPENVVAALHKRGDYLGIGYTTYARHYLQKKLGVEWT